MNRPTPSLRPVEASDREFLLRVYASTRESELRIVPWTPEQKAQFVAVQFTAQDDDYREKFPEAQFSVIESDGEPVGRVYVAGDDARVHILDITVLPAYRGRGIGSQIVRELQQEATAKGLPLTIYVSATDASAGLFESLGFRQKSADELNVLLEWSADAAKRD